MKIIFFGTPSFAANVLQYLLEQKISVAAVVTQPDRPQGRKLQLAAPAVKLLAQKFAEIPIFQPEKASNPAFLEQISALHADLFVVVAFGQILSRKLLAIPPLGCINVHASLLPKYRGAAPMQRALMNGDAETGVCIQKMVYELDAGDVIDEAKLSIPLEMTLGELQEQLCALSKPLLFKVLREYQNGAPEAHPQDATAMSFAPKIQPEETEIHWNQDAMHLHNLIRALSPRPGAWCWIDQNGEHKRLKILRSKPASYSGSPGQTIIPKKDSCCVATQAGSLELLEVQPEGKRPMAASDWIRGCTQPPHFYTQTI